MVGGDVAVGEFGGAGEDDFAGRIADEVGHDGARGFHLGAFGMNAEGELGFVGLATGEDQGKERKEEKQDTAHGGIKSEDDDECKGGGGWVRVPKGSGG